MKRGAMLCGALLLLAGAFGCRTTAGSGSAQESPGRSGKAVKQSAPPIPAGSPFAQLRTGMRRAQVDDLIGQPTSTRSFPSGKGFIPYYHGPDAVRTGAFYRGLGRIVFSGAGIVVEIEYDPTEDGY